jgi:hypothetical protein
MVKLFVLFVDLHLVESAIKMHNYVHIPIHNHGHINSKIRPPIDVTGSRKIFPSKGGIAISVDIRSTNLF